MGELAEIVRGASPRPIQNPKWFDSNSDIGWLRISDVTKQNGRIYNLEQKISKAGEEKTRVLTESHLLLSIAATVGKPVINYVKSGVHDGFLIFINPSFNKEFMFQWLEMFRPKWQKYGQPGSQVNLNSELVKNQDILLPIIKEQTKIGIFFKQLDDTIALHQRKLEKLKQLKKGYLQLMFPQKDEKTPKLRFANFSLAWKKRKLGGIAPLRGGFAFQSKKFVKKGIPIIRISNILSNETVGGDYAFYQEQENDGNFLLPDKAAILAMSGATTGKVSILVNPYNQKIYQNQRVGYFRKTEIIDYTFISTIVKSQLFTNQLKSVLVAGAQPNISSKEIDSFEFFIPLQKEEQIKLGAFFKKIDNAINLHQKKVSTLQDIKKSYLQKIFV
ncbi:restriction endonuclease subunit S [Desemzia sp. FAM 24101]